MAKACFIIRVFLGYVLVLWQTTFFVPICLLLLKKIPWELLFSSRSLSHDDCIQMLASFHPSTFLLWKVNSTNFLLHIKVNMRKAGKTLWICVVLITWKESRHLKWRIFDSHVFVYFTRCRRNREQEIVLQTAFI